MELLLSTQNDTAKGVMFDTDKSCRPKAESDMISNNQVSATGRSKRYILSSFREGDFVLYYSTGKGVISIGKILSAESEKMENGLYRNVEMVYPTEKMIKEIGAENLQSSLSASEIQKSLDKRFFFASTIKSPFLDNSQVDILIRMLKNKY